MSSHDFLLKKALDLPHSQLVIKSQENDPPSQMWNGGAEEQCATLSLLHWCHLK